MNDWLSYILFAAALVTAAPIAIVVIECLAALWPRRSICGEATLSGARPRVDVLIPAHNEEAVLAATLKSVNAQTRPGDRVFVVADNCIDRTAEVARQCGAIAVERNDLQRRGKGYALDFGVRQLAAGRADYVVIIDADCTLAEGTLDALARQCAATGKPVQGGYVMTSPASPSPRDLVSRVAVAVKNQVRQRGVSTLGGPAILTGSGMAFPWATLTSAHLASGNIVEDMQLSFDLLLAGHAPTFCSAAEVVAPLPQQRNASLTQRTRWEHGHLQTLLRRVPRLAWQGVRQCRPQLLFAAADLAVPPLSLLVTAWFGVFVASLCAAAGGLSPLPLVVSSITGALLLAAIAVACKLFAPDVSLGRLLTAVPTYVIGKLPIYAKFLLRRQITWVRTDRDVAPSGVATPHLPLVSNTTSSR
ncbi:MAG: glycosyltransferase [Planctomycetales bacterium]|nr:glycosyltransferase [Planctomycetales bacterium]MBN8624424.1 glycosyltransferase [Planctomycetota bacterium]